MKNCCSWLPEAVAICGVAIGVGVAFQGWPAWPEAGGQTWAAWVQAVGSIAAILAAVWISHRDNANANKRALAAERSEAAALLKMIEAELAVQWNQYNMSAGALLVNVQAEQPFLSFWQPPAVPFTVQSSCVGRLIAIDDAELRQKIILAYAEFTLLLRQFGVNNREIDSIEQTNRMLIQGFDAAEQLQLESLRRMRNNATSLKNAHERAGTYVNEACAAISKYLEAQSPSLKAQRQPTSFGRETSV